MSTPASRRAFLERRAAKGQCQCAAARPLFTKTKCRECALRHAAAKHPAPVLRPYTCATCGRKGVQTGKGKQRRYCVRCSPMRSPRKGETYAYEVAR